MVTVVLSGPLVVLVFRGFHKQAFAEGAVSMPSAPSAAMRVAVSPYFASKFNLSFSTCDENFLALLEDMQIPDHIRKRLVFFEIAASVVKKSDALLADQNSQAKDISRLCEAAAGGTVIKSDANCGLETTTHRKRLLIQIGRHLTRV
jgi:hypothetical protein